ncbi:MAG: hypothetical protein PUE13_01170 [Clostridiales bacterium]|nr:hypothetical protein [Clostridiales bacterium]
MDEYIANAREAITERFPAVGFQDVKVCMPVNVKVCGEVGKIESHCMGKPIINPGCGTCPGKCQGSCQFTITQKLRVKIPVVFKVKANAGEAAIDFDAAHCPDNCECDN